NLRACLSAATSANFPSSVTRSPSSREAGSRRFARPTSGPSTHGGSRRCAPLPPPLLHHQLYPPLRHVNRLDQLFAFEQFSDPLILASGLQYRCFIGSGRHADLATHLAVDLHRQIDGTLNQGRFIPNWPGLQRDAAAL